jgi:cytochrome c2
MIMTKIKKQSVLHVLLKTSLGIAIVLSAASPVFSQEQDAYKLPENPFKGGSVFIEKGCIKCHTVWGVGEPFGPDLTQIGMEKDFFELAGALWSHSPKMIEVMEEKGVERPVFSPEETEALLAYIYYLGFIDELGNYQKGEEIFEQKSCSACHSLGGSPDKSGPALDKYGRYVSPVYFAAALWNHSATVSRVMIERSFAPKEMCHLLAFIKGNAENRSGETIYIQPGSPKNGREVFVEKQCISCHSREGFDLQESELRKSLTEIVGMMWNHSSPMWEEMRSRGQRIPRFEDSEMSDLTAYLYFIPYYGENGDAARGKVIFEEKGCASCHSSEAIDEGKGIDLEEIASSSFFEMVSIMWNHAPEMEKMVTEMDQMWPRFEKDEMKELIAYIQSLR